MKLFKALLAETSDVAKVEAWKNEVRKAYPKEKLKFSFKDEGGKHLIVAEVSGKDRCYGVFDTDELKGEVLGEE